VIADKHGVIARTGRSPRVERAAARIAERLAEAKEHGHYRNGWYAYIDRADVETLVEYARR
jgi:hypothetical protein